MGQIRGLARHKAEPFSQLIGFKVKILDGLSLPRDPLSRTPPMTATIFFAVTAIKGILERTKGTARVALLPSVGFMILSFV